MKSIRTDRMIDPAELREFQTERLRLFQAQTAHRHGVPLTPIGVASALRAADGGEVAAQFSLFDAMVDEDSQMRGVHEIRKSALCALEWRILPPQRPTPSEVQIARWVETTLKHGLASLPSVFGALMEAYGYGFAAVEMSWTNHNGAWVPRFEPRPQSWFKPCSGDGTRVSLWDELGNKHPLRPASWIVHINSGNAVHRAGIFRPLVWPFIWKRYALEDYAEFLEVYGVPVTIGRYPQGASSVERKSLMQAVVALGHRALAIVPQDMGIEVLSPALLESSREHQQLVDWADDAIHKAVLGYAEGASGGAAKLHKTVKRDILVSDAKRLSATLSRDLVRPMVRFNFPAASAQRRSFRFAFDLEVPSEWGTYADALPKLVGTGIQMPVEWAHRKLGIPRTTPEERRIGERNRDSGDR